MWRNGIGGVSGALGCRFNTLPGTPFPQLLSAWLDATSKVRGQVQGHMVAAPEGRVATLEEAFLDLVLPQLRCRSQLWLGSGPWPRNFICLRVAKRRKKRRKAPPRTHHGSGETTPNTREEGITKWLRGETLEPEDLGSEPGSSTCSPCDPEHVT